MILSFKQQFIETINSGTKIHSFREDPKKRWRQGLDIQMATGVRTKHYNCFNDQHKCISVQECKLINHPSSVIMVFDDVYVFHWVDIVRIAKNDGFDNPYAFLNFFFGDHTKNYGEKSLRCIHWTDFKYDYRFSLISQI